MRNRGVVAVVGASLLVGVGLFGAACKKTVEGENKSWDRNVAKVAELAALYPSFATALNEQKKKAEEAMTAAKAISDAEQSAKKMADANALLESGSFVGKLGGLDAKQKALREKSVTVSSASTDPADAAAAKAATDDAQRILKNFDDAIKAGAPNADAATAVVRKIEDDLTSATANLDKVIAAAKAKKDAAAKAASAVPGAGAAGGGPGATGAAVAKAPDWQCPFCKHMNADSRQTCTECGGGKPAPGAGAKPGAAAKPGAPGAKPGAPAAAGAKK